MYGGLLRAVRLELHLKLEDNLDAVNASTERALLAGVAPGPVETSHDAEPIDQRCTGECGDLHDVVPLVTNTPAHCAAFGGGGDTNGCGVRG